MICEHCGGVMFHKKDYRSSSWNIRHAPTHLHELWVCVDCTIGNCGRCKLEQAVIKAAERVAEEPDKTLGWTDLVAAVEALQKARSND